MAEPINPITVRGVKSRLSKEPINLSIGRIWITSTGERKEVRDGVHRLHPDEVLNKYITVIAWDGDDNEPHALAEMLLDEDNFLRGLQHLFPGLSYIEPRR